MLKIAITGNIASGKTLFENFLKASGFKVLCLDNVTASLYESSEALKSFLLKKFNTISRAEVAKAVFSDAGLKKELEDFIYPLILNEMNSFFLLNKNEKILFVSAAMLFEAGFQKYFDKTVLIAADENIRLKRLVKRNNLTNGEAMLRINAQMPADSKIPLSDYVIDNSGTEEELKSAAEAFIRTLPL